MDTAYVVAPADRMLEVVHELVDQHVLVVFVGIDAIVAEHVDARRRAGPAASVIGRSADFAIAEVAITADRPVLGAPVDVERLELERRVAVLEYELNCLVDRVGDRERGRSAWAGVRRAAESGPAGFRKQVANLARAAGVLQVAGQRVERVVVRVVADLDVPARL